MGVNYLLTLLFNVLVIIKSDSFSYQTLKVKTSNINKKVVKICKLHVCLTNDTQSFHPSNTWKLCISTGKVWQWQHMDGPSWRLFYCLSTQRPCCSLGD